MSHVIFAIFAVSAVAVAGLAAANSYSLPLISNSQQQYVANISVGTPALNLTVLLSLSTTNLIVYSNKLQTSSLITYLNSPVRGGILAKADMSIAGLNITGQEFILSFANSPDTSIDGVLGLGYTAQNDLNISSPMYNMIAQYPQTQQLFSLDLQPTSNSRSGLDEVLLGGIDDSLQMDQFAYANNANCSTWSFNCSELFINSTSLASNVSALLSLGFDGVAVPDVVLSSLTQYLQLHGNGSTAYMLPCDDDTPVFTFTIASSNFTLYAKDIMWPADEATNGSAALCNVSIQNSGSENWVLGTAFLVKYYTLFDAGAARIGFANYSNPSESTTASPSSSMPTTIATTSAQPTLSTSKATSQSTSASPSTAVPTKDPTKHPGNDAVNLFSWTAYSKILGVFMVLSVIR